MSDGRRLQPISPQALHSCASGDRRSQPQFRLQRSFSLPSRYRECARSAAASAVAQAAPHRRARIWVPCCKTGGVAYAAAMLLMDAAAEYSEALKIAVFGTDTDEEALELARSGRYPVRAALGMDARWRSRYTLAEGSDIRIRESLRRSCIFSRHALGRDRPLPRLDLLVYVPPARRGELLEHFHHALRPGGSLLVLDHVDRYKGSLFEQVGPARFVARSPFPARKASLCQGALAACAFSISGPPMDRAVDTPEASERRQRLCDVAPTPANRGVPDAAGKVGHASGAGWAEATWRDVDRQKDDFIALLGHELRNPMAAIRNATELLGRVHGATAELLRLQSILERQTLQMAKLIEQLLDLARVSRGKLEVQRERLDLVELVNHAVDDRSEQFSGRRLRLLLPEAALWVEADRVRLTQILDNLLSNALKFTRSYGTITIEIEASPAICRLRVRDDGNGIAPELLPHIFDAFRQGDSMRSQGLGLGLALVKGLCELHGFALAAHSDGPGRGACFTIELPLVAVPGAPPPAVRVDRRRLELLLIEDNRDVAETLAELLQTEGHRVQVVGSAEQGLDVLSERRPDIVISDIGLPGMDGLELARRIRIDPALAAVRLLALTGFGSAASESQINAAGFDRCLTKPVLIDALRRCLSHMAAR